MEQLRMITILEMSLSNSISKAVHRRDIHSPVHFLGDIFFFRLICVQPSKERLVAICFDDLKIEAQG